VLNLFFAMLINHNLNHEVLTLDHFAHRQSVYYFLLYCRMKIHRANIRSQATLIRLYRTPPVKNPLSMAQTMETTTIAPTDYTSHENTNLLKLILGGAFITNLKMRIC
jgi:hypothetical protein